MFWGRPGGVSALFSVLIFSQAAHCLVLIGNFLAGMACMSGSIQACQAEAGLVCVGHISV